MALAATASQAQVERTVRIETEPAAARVSLLTGERRELLGLSPLDFRAEFHSEHSVLRLLVERAGRVAERVELTPQQSVLRVKLRSRGLVGHGVPHAEALQGILSTALDAASPAACDMDELAQVTGVDRQWKLAVRLRCEPATEPEAAPDWAWQSAAQPFLRLAGPGLGALPGLTGLQVKVLRRGVRHSFSVATAAQEDAEWRCVPGQRQVFDSCARTSTNTGSFGKCLPGYRTVLDPCLDRQLVTVRSTTTAIRSGAQADDEAVTFEWGASALVGRPVRAEWRLEEAHMLHTGPGGRVLEERQARRQ